MDDIARLIIDIDTKMVEVAERRLESFSQEARKTEKETSTATSRISRNFVTMGSRAEGASSRLSAATSRTRNMGIAAQNASFQVADFFVQVGAGTSVTQALAQQLPQLLGGLGMVGAAAGAAVAVVGGLWHVFGEGEDQAKSFDEAMDSLTSGLQDYNEMVENSRLSTDELQKKFASTSEVARGLYEQLANIEKGNLRSNASAAISTLIPDYVGDSVNDRPDIRDMFGLRSGPRDRRYVAGQMDLERNLQNADGTEEQLEAARKLLTNTQALAEVNGNISAIERQRITQLSQLVLKLNEVNTQTNDQIQAEREAAEARAESNANLASMLEARIDRAEEAHEQEQKRDAKAIEARRTRIMSLLDQIEAREKDIEENRLSAIKSRAEEAIKAAEKEAKAREDRDKQIIDNRRTRILSLLEEVEEREKATADARADIGEMERAAEVRRVEAEYGQESLEAARARVEAEREAYEELVSSLDVSEDLKSEMMEAWDAANGLSESDIASIISQAANEAGRLSGNLASAMAALRSVEAGMQAANRRALNEVRIKQETVGKPVDRAGRLARADYQEKSGAAAYEAMRSGDFGALDQISDAEDNFANQARDLAAAEESLREAEKSFAESLKDDKKKGGGGGSSKKSDEERAMEQDAARVMREIEKAHYDAMDAIERYKHEYEELSILHEAGYLSAEAFANAVKMLQQELHDVQLENFKSGLDSVSELLTDVAVGGESLRGRLASVFRGIAADLMQAGIKNALVDQFSTSNAGGGLFGIISGIGGLISGKSIKQPSYEGGGKTPSGPRSGGVDGKGGFNAILHPDETVIDHKKNGGSGKDQVEIVGGKVFLSDDGTIMAEVEARSRRQSERTLNTKGPSMVSSTMRRMENQGKS